MSLILYKDGILAGDTNIAFVEHPTGPGTTTARPKIFNSDDRTVAFGCAGLTMSEMQGRVLAQIFLDDLRNAGPNPQPEFATRHRGWFKNNVGYDGASYLIMTKKNLFNFDKFIYTRQEDAPAALGTGCFMALTFMRNGMDAHEAVRRTSELMNTVSREHNVIKRHQLRAFNFKTPK